MPKIPIDYSKTIIYKFKCNDLNITDEYYGSTCHFINRKWQHKADCYNPNCEKYNQKKYLFIRANGGWDNWQMIEVEKYPCKDKNEARARENYHIELNQSKLNMIKAFLSEEVKKENLDDYQKEYRENHKEVNKQYQKEYQKIRITCSCGKEIGKSEITKHIKTKFHLLNEKK